MGSLRPFVAIAVLLAACGGNDSAASSTVEIVLAQVNERTVSLVFIANAEDIDRAEVDWGDGLVVRVDGDGRFTAEHTYDDDGTYPVVATVFAGGSSVHAAQTIQIGHDATTTSPSTTEPEVSTTDPAVTTTDPAVTTTDPASTSIPGTMPPTPMPTAPPTTAPPTPTPTTAPPTPTTTPTPTPTTPTTAPPLVPVSITKSFAQRSSVAYQNSGPNGSSSGTASGVNVYAKAAGVNEVSVGQATITWTFPVADFGWTEPRASVSVFIDTSWLGVLTTSSSSGNSASINLDATGSVGSNFGSASDFRTLAPGYSQTYGINDPLGFGNAVQLDTSSTITVTMVVKCTARGADTIFGVFGGSECDFSSGNRGVDMTVRVTLRPE